MTVHSPHTNHSYDSQQAGSHIPAEQKTAPISINNRLAFDCICIVFVFARLGLVSGCLAYFGSRITTSLAYWAVIQRNVLGAGVFEQLNLNVVRLARSEPGCRVLKRTGFAGSCRTG